MASLQLSMLLDTESRTTFSVAIRLEERYKGIRSPHKFKGGVSGCIRECAEAQSKDFGLIATDKGWNSKAIPYNYNFSLVEPCTQSFWLEMAVPTLVTLPYLRRTSHHPKLYELSTASLCITSTRRTDSCVLLDGSSNSREESRSVQ